ncbi:MAG: phosphoribosyltransferase family protein [Flavihumibacter sp.]|nr:phosphoribosyltransferase family protein [Flavihumibacter sp.]
MALVKNWANGLMQLFFPHTCAACGSDVLNEESALCMQCLHQLPVTNFNQHANNPVEKIFWGKLPITAATSYCHFTKQSLIQNILHQAKYKNNQQAAIFMGNLLGNSLQQSNRFNTIDAIVPLPLFAARLKKRGYNQAALIARGIAAQTGKPVIETAVTRLSATETQTHKNRVERWQNMQGRFMVTNAAVLENKHVLLVDDVVTTGATLEACGQELLTIKGTQLSIATVAYTV